MIIQGSGILYFLGQNCGITQITISVGMTPFKVLYGRETPLLPALQTGKSVVDSVEATIIKREDIIEKLKKNLKKAQINMKVQANKHRRYFEFNINDWVMVKLKPYRQIPLATQHYNK